ncbi:T3SS secreted effector EspN-like protein [Salmonella enterica subsp. enterica serovar Poona]|nr:T3SS secreted effector EspN-like protein [Salmonella enterica subsp. enterica serovar Poona]
MRITVSDISTRESQQTVQIQAIRSWDTIPYLSMLDGLYQDDIFHEQISNLPEEYIKLDEMAKDEEKNSLNIYEFFFEPTHEIICEEIQSTLDFYYSNSATFRRLVNYKVERSINDDVDTNKCEVKISLNYSYENIDGGRGCLSLPFDQNGYPIPPDFHNCVNGITSKKLLLDLFLKHILHDHLNASGEVANVYANVIYKEIDPAAIAHTSSCFSQVTMSGEHELFNVDSVTVPPKSTEQIIFEGKEIQKQIFLSSHSRNHLQPVTIHKMDRSIKNIAVTGLLLSSRLAVTSGDYRIKNGNSEGENDFLPVKELQRYERALPEDHPAPTTEPNLAGKVLDGLFEHVTSMAGGRYRKQASYPPLSSEAPNTIKYGDRELVLTKEPGSETYQATYSDSGKNSAMTFYRSSDGRFYQASGLKGGGLIRHIDKPYSELREGDTGYDEELLDITDDSPLLEDILASLSEDLYPTSEENVQSIYKKYQSGDAAAGETEVVLCRGTIGPQAENIVSFKTAGGIEGGDVEVLPVSAEIAKEQVRSGRIVPEYTTDLSVADRFSREHYLIIVRVKVKYLTRGSVSESGWVMPKKNTSGPCWYN